MAGSAHRPASTSSINNAYIDDDDIHNDELVAEGISHALRLKPSWQLDDLHIDRCAAAISNQVFRLSHHQESMLLRIYGVELPSREQELHIATRMGEMGLGAQVLDWWGAGRLEQWIDSRPLTHAEMCSAECSSRLARMLRAFHERTRLSHNDLHCNNILCAPTTGELTFIDYEYAAPLDASYDIANHWCEWMFPYEDPEVVLPDERLYPSLHERTRFCAAYLDLGPADPEVAALVEEVEARTGDVHDAWAAWAEANYADGLWREVYAPRRRELARRQREALRKRGRL